jgi:hypothetical protein
LASSSAFLTAHSGAAKGMILIVASIWRGSTRSNGFSVAMVMLSWIALMALMRATSTRKRPRSTA